MRRKPGYIEKQNRDGQIVTLPMTPYYEVDPGVWEPIRHYLGLLSRLECTETDDLDDTENLAIALRIYAIALERRNELRRDGK